MHNIILMVNHHFSNCYQKMIHKYQMFLIDCIPPALLPLMLNLMVQNIIERLRFHQAPDLVEKSSVSLLVPPSEFDIRFYYAGSINPNIDSIGNCVLTSIDVNYAPNGFQSYEMPGEGSPSWGGTGMPVAIQLTLGFQETTYLTKQDYSSAKDISVSGTQKTSSVMDPYNFS